ncbi:MAG TPA: hypothetical protein VGN61_01850 [Verrucomicrobiae bacterium]|jgi:hypothetical protein
MKPIIAFIAASLGIILPVRAQWIVYDPTVNTQQIIDQAENIAKYIQMINNQMQQIQQLTAQLQQLQQFNKAFGDPSLMLTVPGANNLIFNLEQPSVAVTFTASEQASDGAAALTYNANGLYDAIGATFTTPQGNAVERNPADYRSFEGVNRATENYTNVTAAALQRREALKATIASTTQALQAATTASQVQKLTGVLIGLNSALTATDKEIDQAGTQSLVQDIENRNDNEKQAKARAEEQETDLIQSMGNYSTNFTLTAEPPQFPEGNQ